MLLKSPPALGSLLAAALLMGLAGCSQAQSPKAPAAAKPAAAAKTGDYPAVLKGIRRLPRERREAEIDALAQWQPPVGRRLLNATPARITSAAP